MKRKKACGKGGCTGMKRRSALLFLLCVLLIPVAIGRNAAEAETHILHTLSCFAGNDGAAESYVAILREYEQATGNTVLDESETSSEAWKTGVLKRFAAGDEPDVMFFFAAGADSALLLDRLVPLEEIGEAYPELSLPEDDALTEADGRIYAIPGYSFWEGLLVNQDLFERYGLDLPTDWERLTRAIAVFRENGIVPIAVSLSDIPHYLAEFVMLACVPPEELAARPKSPEDVPASWLEGMRLIRELYEMGAFPENTGYTDEGTTTELFFSKGAAMQFDGSWQVSNLPESGAGTIIALPMPLRNGNGQALAYPGGVSMGFFLTRKAWNSSRRDAAVSLLAALTSRESLQRLHNQDMDPVLQASCDAMMQGRRMVQPIQDAMNQKARETWLLECIPAVADGSMTAEECWHRVMSLNPFGE